MNHVYFYKNLLIFNKCLIAGLSVLFGISVWFFVALALAGGFNTGIEIINLSNVTQSEHFLIVIGALTTFSLLPFVVTIRIMEAGLWCMNQLNSVITEEWAQPDPEKKEFRS
ncbi:MAG: hypothetical protein WC262_10705 [Bacteroidales bacterium]|jgi:hypothetical protein